MTTLPTAETERVIKKLAALIASASMFATSAVAAPAALTATFTFHSSQRTSLSDFGNIHESSPLDVPAYDVSGGVRCSVEISGRDGSVNGNRAKPDRPPRLRSFMTSNDATLMFSQPQFTGCPAIGELNVSDNAKPNYGVINVSGESVAQEDSDQFVITGIQATQVGFAAPDLKKLTYFSLGDLMPRGPNTLSERLVGSLVDYNRLGGVNCNKVDPTKILVNHGPATADGADGMESPNKRIARFRSDTNNAAANIYTWTKTSAPFLAIAGTCGNWIKVPTSAHKSSTYLIDVNYRPGRVARPISFAPSNASPASLPVTSAAKTPSGIRGDSPTQNPTPTFELISTDRSLVLGRSFPNETNTGVPDNLKASLTPYTGPCTITAANVKIDRKIITCDQLRLLGPNTTITNSIINGTVYSDCCYLNGSYSLTDSEVRGPGSTATVIGEARFKLLRVEVSGGSRSVNCNTNCEIRDSYIHGQYGDKRGIDHESGIRQGAHGTFVHNTISCDAIAYPNPSGGEGSGCSAAVSGYGDFGTVNNNTFTNNLIESREGRTGQAASSYCVYGGSTPGKPFPNAHHIVFTDNIFRRGGMGKCGIYGPVTSFDSDAEGSLWQNNLWDDGSTVPPAN